jgi:hypothetical protein
MSGYVKQNIKVSETEQRYKIIGNRSKERRTYLGIQRKVIHDSVLPAIDTICEESDSSLYIDKNQLGDVYDIVLEGSWRAISVASFLLKRL